MSSTSTSPLRVAIVGGGIGRAYADAFSAHPDASVVAVCTRVPSRSQAFAADFGLDRGYSDVRKMIESESLDLLVIAAPNAIHLEVGSFAVANGINIVCEKPVGRDLSETQTLLRVAEQAGVTHFVPFTWRFLPAVDNLRELVKDGVLGSTLSMTIRYHVCAEGSPIRQPTGRSGQMSAGGGVIAHLGSHAFDLVHWILGPIEEVAASSSVLREGDSGLRAMPPVAELDESMAEVTLRTASGVPVSVSLSSVSAGPRVDFEMRILGTAGVAKLSVDWSRHDMRQGRLEVSKPDQQFTPIDCSDRSLPGSVAEHRNPFFVSFVRMADQTVRAIRENRAASPNLRDAVQARIVIDKAEKSALSRIE